MSRWTRLALTATALTALAACGPGFDESSGKDAMRGDATEIPMDTAVDDRVSAEQGDHTDWKVFELAQGTIVKVNIWWDDPDVEAHVRLRGMGGGAQRTLKHVSGKKAESLGPIELQAGKWFLEIQAQGGASVYTLQVVSEGAARQGTSDLPDF